MMINSSRGNQTCLREGQCVFVQTNTAKKCVKRKAIAVFFYCSLDLQVHSINNFHAATIVACVLFHRKTLVLSITKAVIKFSATMFMFPDMTPTVPELWESPKECQYTERKLVFDITKCTMFLYIQAYSRYKLSFELSFTHCEILFLMSIYGSPLEVATNLKKKHHFSWIQPVHQFFFSQRKIVQDSFHQ